MFFESLHSFYIGLYYKISFGLDFGLWEVPKIDDNDDDHGDYDVFSLKDLKRNQHDDYYYDDDDDDDDNSDDDAMFI